MGDGFFDSHLCKMIAICDTYFNPRLREGGDQFLPYLHTVSFQFISSLQRIPDIIPCLKIAAITCKSRRSQFSPLAFSS